RGQVGLAEDDSPGCPQPRHRVGVAHRYMSGVFRSARGGSESGGLEGVFDRDWQSMQRSPTLAAGERGVCCRGALEGAVIEGHYGVYGGVEPVDSRTKVIEQLTAADASFAQRRGELGCGFQRQVD